MDCGPLDPLRPTRSWPHRHPHPRRRAQLNLLRDIDLDGMTYRVHRGPRRRTLVEITDEQGQPAHRFELEETVWVAPVEPDPLPLGECLWCDFGPPDTLRLAGQDDGQDGYLVALAEHADGSGRILMLQFNPDDDDADAGFDTYCLVLDPGQHRFYGGITECVLDQQQLQLRLTPEAATTLGVDVVLRFHLDWMPLNSRCCVQDCSAHSATADPTPDPNASSFSHIRLIQRTMVGHVILCIRIRCEIPASTTLHNPLALMVWPFRSPRGDTHTDNLELRAPAAELFNHGRDFAPRSLSLVDSSQTD